MVESYVPKADFSFIGNLPGNYYQGQQIGRERLLRDALSKIAPDDFQGMARALMQFGDPKQGVEAMQLQNQLHHQTIMEGLAARSAATSEAGQRSTEQAREDSISLRNLKYGAPLDIVSSSIPLFEEDAKALLKPGEGWKAAWTGERAAATDHMARAVAQLTGLDENKFAEETRITAADYTPELRKRKLDLLASHIPGLGDISRTLKLGDPSRFKINPEALKLQPADQVPETVDLRPAPAGRGGLGAGESAAAGEVQPRSVQTVPISPPGTGEPPPVTVQGHQYPLTPKAAAALKAGSLTPEGWAIISADPKYVALRKLYGLIP